MDASILSLAQAESTISLGIALTFGGMLVGGALTYGALRQTVSDLKLLLGEVKNEVATLRSEVVKLSTEVEIMKRVEARVEEITAKHPADPPRRDPRRE